MPPCGKLLAIDSATQHLAPKAGTEVTEETFCKLSLERSAYQFPKIKSNSRAQGKLKSELKYHSSSPMFETIFHLRTFFCTMFLIFTFPNTLKVFASHFGGVSEFFFRATLASAHFVRCQNFPEFFLLHLQLLGNASVLWCSNQPSLRLMGKIALFTSPCFTSAQRIFLQQVHEF